MYRLMKPWHPTPGESHRDRSPIETISSIQRCEAFGNIPTDFLKLSLPESLLLLEKPQPFADHLVGGEVPPGADARRDKLL